MQKACAELGFDWKSVDPVFDKIREELDEITEAMHNTEKSFSDVEDEVGDMFFACVNLARHLSVDPVLSLHRANQKFARRFDLVKKLHATSLAKGETSKTLEQMTPIELDQFWELAKKTLKTR